MNVITCGKFFSTWWKWIDEWMIELSTEMIVIDCGWIFLIVFVGLCIITWCVITIRFFWFVFDFRWSSKSYEKFQLKLIETYQSLLDLSSFDEVDLDEILVGIGLTIVAGSVVSIVDPFNGFPLSLIKCFRHNSSRCAAIKQPGIEQIFRQTTPSNFFREPFSISIISPFFGLLISTDGGITAIERRWLAFGIEDWILKGTGTWVGIRDDGEFARRRLRDGDEISERFSAWNSW